MELAHHQRGPPPPRPLAICLLNGILKHEQTRSVEQTQQPSHYDLGMLKPHERNDRLAQTREDDRANKGPRHRSRKAEVVICLPEALMDVGRRGAVDENVVYGLQIERLLDLCVRGD